MRLLLDQGLPRDAAGLLRDNGHDAEHVGDLGFAQATDSDILRLAREQNRVVVTLDSDFHMLLAFESARQPSVVRVRQEGLRAEELIVVINEVLTRCAPALIEGAAVTVVGRNIRLRRLPFKTSESGPVP